MYLFIVTYMHKKYNALKHTTNYKESAIIMHLVDTFTFSHLADLSKATYKWGE